VIGDIQSMARALNGVVRGGQVLCPGPGHGPNDRSLSVRLSADAPMHFIAYSSAGDDWILCRDHVARLLGLSQ
jgi:putative DNA primase/helicase